jgi:hypothetical protein
VNPLATDIADLVAAVGRDLSLEAAAELQADVYAMLQLAAIEPGPLDLFALQRAAFHEANKRWAADPDDRLASAWLQVADAFGIERHVSTAFAGLPLAAGEQE